MFFGDIELISSEMGVLLDGGEGGGMEGGLFYGWGGWMI